VCACLSNFFFNFRRRDFFTPLLEFLSRALRVVLIVWNASGYWDWALDFMELKNSPPMVRLDRIGRVSEVRIISSTVSVIRPGFGYLQGGYLRVERRNILGRWSGLARAEVCTEIPGLGW
jgi:hypothetical protein